MTSNRTSYFAGKPQRTETRVRLRTSGLLTLIALAQGCLDRPIAETHPETQNIFVKQNKSSKIDKIDVLFMIDNSVSMADKQKVLAAAVPQLLRRLTTPYCIDPKNPAAPPEVVNNPTIPCTTAGYVREFSPVNDIHIGIVTSSLGDFGGSACELTATDIDNKKGPAKDDKGWLLGALSRTQGKLRSPFLAWTDADASNFDNQIPIKESEFKDFVTSSGETGCGFEMSLESWYRFLVDPEPPTSIEMVSDGISPNSVRSGLDTQLLAQRKAFLRPDSLLAIVMLSDENDCSVRDSGRSWILTGGSYSNVKLRTGSSACALNPNDPCCYSCNDGSPPAGCPADPNCSQSSTIVANADYNLNCFRQKERFGYDFLFPTSRYVNALKLKEICPYQNFGDLDCECKGHEGETCVPGDKFPNPLYTANADTLTQGIQPRAEANMIFLTGIVGVPWQDIATPESLAQNAFLDYLPSSKINWDLLLPDAFGNPAKDPLMRESVKPREGVHPVTNEPIGEAPTGQTKFNSINYHEWQPAAELQFACVFDLNQPLSDEVDTDGMPGETRNCTPCTGTDPNCKAPPNGCSCKTEGSLNSPLCQDPTTGNYGTIQYAAKAYPGVRQLEVLKGHNDTAKDNSIVASICPKNLNWAERDQPGYGYNPAVASLVERLKTQLVENCLPRPLAVEDGKLSCIVVEAVTNPEWGQCELKGRKTVEPSLTEIVRAQMKTDKLCDFTNTQPCSSYQFCALEQLSDDMDPSLPLTQCQNKVGYETESPIPGFCYIDPEQSIGNPELVTKCASTQKRKLRIVGNATDKRAPAPGWTFIACSGASPGEYAQ